MKTFNKYHSCKPDNMKLAKWSLLITLCSTVINDSYGAVRKGRVADKAPQQVKMVTSEVTSSRNEASELLARQLAGFSITTITNAPSKAPSNAPSKKPFPKISVAAPVTYNTKAPVPKTTSTTSAPVTYYYTKAPVPETTSTTSAPVPYYYTKAPVPMTTASKSISKKPKGAANTFGSGSSAGSSTSFNSSTSSSSGGIASPNMNYPLDQINPGGSSVTTGGTVKPNIPPGQGTTGGVGSGFQYTVIGGNPPQTAGLPDQNGSTTYTTLPSQTNIINTGGIITEPQNSGSPDQGGSIIYTTLPSQMNNVVPGGNPTTSSGQTVVISTPVKPVPKGMFSNNGS